jgi:hypothetical protein
MTVVPTVRPLASDSGKPAQRNSLGGRFVYGEVARG